MPGFLATPVGSQVLCAHTGRVTTALPNPRVAVNGQYSLLLTGPAVIAGCILPPPFIANGPCVSAPLIGTTRVRSHGFPLVVISTPVLCIPTGTPLIIASTPKVTAI